MKRLSFALPVLVLASIASAPASASNGYTVTPLPGTADGPFYAHEVMPNGYVTGTGGNTARAVVWTASGGIQELSYVDPNTMMDTPLAGLGVPVGMTSDLRRVALGTSKWVWIEGQLVEVPFLEMGANFSPMVNAMNLGGLVVGEGNVPWAATTAYVWDGEEATVLGPMDQVSAARAISTGGTIVGWVHDAMNNPVPHVFQGGGGAGSLGLPEGYFGGEPTAVNDAGDVVGRVWDGSGDVGWAYVGGEHHVFEDLDCVLAINASGQMLGQVGLGCALAWGQPPSFSVDGGETWTSIASLLDGETPYSTGDDLQGVGIDDAGRIAVNVRTVNFDEGVLILTPEGSGELDFIVDAPSAVQGGPAFDYDATLQNMGLQNVDNYDLAITFSGDAKLGEGVIPAECTATKDADQWVSQIDCVGFGPVGPESEELRRFSMVPSQLGVVTANFVATAELSDGSIENLVMAVDTTVSDDAADLSVEIKSGQFGSVVRFEVINTGPDMAQKPRLELTMQGATFEPLEDDVAEECERAEDNTVLRCTITSLAVSENWEQGVLAKVEEDLVRIDAEVESDTPDPDLSNNSFSHEPVTEEPGEGCGGGCSTTGTSVWGWSSLILLFAWRRRRR